MNLAGLVLALVLLPEVVAAHGGLPGGGGFYSGAAHPFIATEQLLVLFSFGLALGQPGPAFSRIPLLGLALGLAAGLTGIVFPAPTVVVALGLTLVFGGILAASLRPPLAVLLGAATLLGWVVGDDTDVPQTAAAGWIEALVPHAGVFVGVFLIALNATAIAVLARRPLFSLALRIAGSWIAAIGLIVLALRMREVVAA